MIIKTGGPGAESQRLAEESQEAFERAGVAPDPLSAAIEFAVGVDRAGDAELAAAYTYLQRAVGVIAVLLPATLALGHLLIGGDEPGLRGSISAYYYTHMGNVFVGALCALAVFFLSYNYRPIRSFETDNVLSRFASLAAVGVAVFPTADDAVFASNGERIVSTLHLVCAGALFGLLGVFAMFRFTMTGSGVITDEKRLRNRLYRICGTLIFASMALVLVSNVVTPPPSWHTLFWLETVCVVAFGTSWLVKGGFLGILADKPRPSTASTG